MELKDTSVNQKTVVNNTKIEKNPENNLEKTSKIANKLVGIRHNFIFQAGILVLVDLICLLLIFIFLSILPAKAQEAKKLKSLSLKIQAAKEKLINPAELVSEKQIADLQAVFPKDEGLVNFINEIDSLKKQGLVNQFSFASEKPVKDKNGYLVLPIVIQFSGSEAEVNYGLNKILSLPYLFRAINVEISKVPNEDKVSLKYGGVLYINEKNNTN